MEFFVAGNDIHPLVLTDNYKSVFVYKKIEAD